MNEEEGASVRARKRETLTRRRLPYHQVRRESEDTTFYEFEMCEPPNIHTLDFLRHNCKLHPVQVKVTRHRVS